MYTRVDITTIDPQCVDDKYMDFGNRLKKEINYCGFRAWYPREYKSLNTGITNTKYT